MWNEPEESKTKRKEKVLVEKEETKYKLIERERENLVGMEFVLFENSDRVSGMSRRNLSLKSNDRRLSNECLREKVIQKLHPIPR